VDEDSVPTDLIIDDKLLETARRLGGHRTKREAVTVALTEYIQRRNRLAALKTLGTIDFDRGFDYKQARRKR
jgi:Arc/MetJ family transcription regulator